MSTLRLALAGLLVTASAQAAAPPPDSPAGRVAAMESELPPWQEGANNGAREKGLVFTVPPADSLSDFHGSLDDPALVLYASGNYFFAMVGLVRAFGEAYPAYRGRVFYETLPPGLLMKQLAAGGTVTTGNTTFTVKPDVMMAEQRATQAWVQQGLLAEPVISFATNDLTIMVPKGNPAHVAGLADLARADLAAVMPNPAFEGVAQQIRASLVKAGGETLAHAVYEEKVAAGTTVLTRIHHRQTPLWLMEGFGSAGVTWTSEAIFQEKQGHPIEHVAIPESQNTQAIYSAAPVAHPAHPGAVRDWLAFLKTDAAFAELAPFGFKRHAP